MLCSVDNMQAFALWLLEEIPNFLLSEPICYFVGIAILFLVIKLFGSIIKIH